MFASVFLQAPLAQGIERLPPEQKIVGSNPTGGAMLAAIKAALQLSDKLFDAVW